MRQSEIDAGTNPLPALGEPCPGQVPATFSAIAADGVVRKVKLTEDNVAIAAADDDVVRLVPLADYEGLVISVTREEEREAAFVTLLSADPALSVILHRAFEDHEVADLLRAWEIWSDALVVDRFVEMADGSLEHVPGKAAARAIRPVRAAPRRANRHFRTRRPAMFAWQPVPSARGRTAGLGN